MTYQKEGSNYVLRLYAGEELIDTLSQFCAKMNIKGAWVSGLGGSHHVVFGHYNEQTHQYTPFAFDNEAELKEVTNITGNVSVDKIHLHITIGDTQGHAHTGHLLKCVANPTLEVFVQSMSPLHRLPDEASGLTLLDLPKHF